MIPRQDAALLRNLLQSLERHKLNVYRPGRRRSASALILRFSDDIRVSKLFSVQDRGITASEVVARIEQNVDHKTVTTTTASSLKILFMKRANLSSERWSGQIALPGGRRCAEDADDFACVARETQEEIGIPLRSHEFVLLGRLPDHSVAAREVSASEEEGAVHSRFVFLHIGDLTPSVALASHEVESIKWCPLSRISNKCVEPQRVVHHFLHFVPTTSVRTGSMVRDMFPSTCLCFPSILVEESPPWRVWGLALRNVAELVDESLSDAERRRSLPIDWPMFSSNNSFVEYLAIRPFHGYLMLSDPRFQGRRFAQPEMLFWLMTSCCCALSLLHVSLSFLYFTTLAIMMSLDMIEGETWFDRVKDYHENNAFSTSPLLYGSRTTNAVSTDNRDPAVSKKLRESVALRREELLIDAPGTVDSSPQDVPHSKSIPMTMMRSDGPPTSANLSEMEESVWLSEVSSECESIDTVMARYR